MIVRGIQKRICYQVPDLFTTILLVLAIAATITTGCHHKRMIAASNDSHQPPLQKLQTGNKRFSQSHPIHPDESFSRIAEVATEQHPFAVIVCCSDSRVSPELIFDQGLGDLFVIRTAGNIISGVETGSIEYAVEHLKVPLIVVLGHERCGAIQAFVQQGEAPGHVKDIVDSLKQEEEIRQISINETDRVEACVRANIMHGVHQLSMQSEILKERLHSKQLTIVGARYDLDNGQVHYIH